MESNIKGLVAAGHEMASELKAECGAVDMRSVAKLISDLATQLEVQLVRANALAAENAKLKTAHPQPFGPEMMKALDAYEKYQDEVPEAGMLDAFFILRDSIRVDTPATDAFLAEVRAKAFDDLCAAFVKDATVAGLDDGDIVTVKEATDALLHCAEQLRKGGNQ
ncbi:hypothetical protein LQ740_001255 [Escherichia coli]|uniref:hypothetical protein n=1 Tax=Escherichia coli TaxID=562 RepID=UPI000A2DB011|nr:hypothetical protein [Escherichia coli]EEV2750639.1 hypothetical protein [Escherichia coli O139]EFG1517503.1 hypothetical protein [Escherichia coli]EFL5828637.1 hypothetical protein [Escherichia coli]EIO7378357.1 hypothetical protein [Escherichia coli]EIP6773128.1 hypothetical protein [Escherichia coli]